MGLPDGQNHGRGVECACLHEVGRCAGRNRFGVLHVRLNTATSPPSATPTRLWKRQNEAGDSDVQSGEEEHVIICAFEDIGEVSKALEAYIGEAES